MRQSMATTLVSVLAAASLALSCDTGKHVSDSSTVGLLVGLPGKTLWLVVVDDSLRELTTRDNLLVPTADGFRWVGTVRRCTVSVNKGEGMNIEAGVYRDVTEELFVAKPGDSVTVNLAGIPCDSADTQFESLLAATAQQQGVEPDYIQSGDCAISTDSVTYVSDSVISVEHRDTQSEFCSHAKYYTEGTNEVTGFPKGAAIALSSVLSEAQQKALRAEMQPYNNPVTDEPRDPSTFEDAWSLHRVHGHWFPSVWLWGSIADRGGTDIDLPSVGAPSIVADPPLPIPWVEIQRLDAYAIDAAASPSGSHVVIQLDTALVVARVQNGTLGPVVARVPIPRQSRFVMLRWASPDERKAWSKLIPRLPEARVHVVQPPPS